MKKIQRTYLADLLVELNRKDLRSVEAWCNRNRVKIFYDGKKRFVLAEDFIRAYNAPVLDYYNSLCNLSLDTGNENSGQGAKYVPKGSAAKKFLSSIKT